MSCCCLSFPEQHSHPSIHTITLLLFFPSHFLSFPPFSHTAPCEFCVRKKATQGNALSALRLDLPSGTEKVFIYKNSISSGEKGEGCLTVTYHSFVCLCVRRRVYAQCPSRAVENLYTPVDFPGSFPRFKPPPFL